MNINYSRVFGYWMIFFAVYLTILNIFFFSWIDDWGRILFSVLVLGISFLIGNFYLKIDIKHDINNLVKMSLFLFMIGSIISVLSFTYCATYTEDLLSESILLLMTVIISGGLWGIGLILLAINWKKLNNTF